MGDASSDLSRLFLQAVEIASEKERNEFLTRKCDGAPELRQQLEILISAYGKAGSFLADSPSPLGATQAHRDHSADDGTSEVTHRGRSILELIGRTAAAELPHVALDSSPDEGPSPIVRPGSREMPKNEPDGRYKMLGEIARGGMGAVLKGHDVDLGRDLAVKVLLEEHRDKPAVIQRFVEEAQIGGNFSIPASLPSTSSVNSKIGARSSR